jgi:hypothetical protein
MGLAVLEASRSGYSEALAQAIAQAFMNGGELETVYAGALNSYPNGQCRTIGPLLARKCTLLWQQTVHRTWL